MTFAYMSTSSSKKITRKNKAAKKTTSVRTKTFCISHKEDADGISSAALIKQLFGGDCNLVDYPGMMDALEVLRDNKSLKKLFICDLGLNKQNTNDFISLLDELIKKHISVTYIDHHDLDSKIITKLKKTKVKLIHNTSECTAVLIYDAFKKKLPEHASFIATCAAITDYMEERPVATKLLQMYDRQFALINATVLTYNIVGHQKDLEYLLYLVDELSESKFPYEIPNTYEFAQIQVGKLGDMISKVKKSMKILKNLAYLEVLDSGASGAVNFVLGLSQKNVGIAYKERIDSGIYAVSVRGSRSCKVHLGRLVSSIADELGGSGGGHDKACGAVIPKDKIKRFLLKMNSHLSHS
ncbi:Single-stranded-DNA-specific exonuclease RecJ protein [Marine Group I thaumarchaeote SCGC AAA799-D07]|nr:Single-stranded-DNA-specific exonuclease RecJ protein [Marine Group I thaumarchaeote SCGC AAA799-D07]